MSDAISTPRWTKELPKESGQYWYREDEREPSVIYFDRDLPSVSFCGHDVPLAPYMGVDRQIEGEFWSELITPPL